MLLAALRDGVELRIVVPRRTLRQATERGALEVREVRAGQEADEVRGGVDRTAIQELHRTRWYAGAVPPRAARRPWTYPGFVDTYHRGSVRGKESTLGRKHTHYSTEFRAEAVRLAETSGHSIRQVAMELGISNESLARWMRLARERPAGTPLDDDERAELAELRRRVKVLETEREILRKAAAFFAQETERTR